jgi:outer membrane protein X
MLNKKIMKKIILLVFITLAFANSYSQKKEGFRVGLDFGYIPTSGGAGGLFSIEPKYNLTDNSNIGLRIGFAGMAKDIQNGGSTTTTSAKVSGNSSLVGTYDYYIHKSGSSFAPYIGAGVGYYSLANVEIDDTSSNLPETYSPAVSGVMGALIRGGFEWGGFRMGVEYNLVPDSDMEDLNGNKVGTAKNAYLGINIGFFVGGGKWGK